MAISLAHTFGQIIGHVLEETIEPLLRDFAAKHRLYLDKKGPRPARPGKKVSWTDLYGNSHDLDFVLERGGTDKERGAPVAFIETAWRRYTKHSRNKAQEIQGAISVLALTHKLSCPFTGVILAGVFTEGALTQLRSLDYHILYFPYHSIIEAFRVVGVDADFDEDTTENAFRKKIRTWNALGKKARQKVVENLARNHALNIQKFFGELAETVHRQINRIVVIPLHGQRIEYPSISGAIGFLSSYESMSVQCPVYKFEIQLQYNNGDRIAAEFSTKAAAIEFLSKYN